MSRPLPQMQYRFLGRTGLKVSALSLGGWLTYGGHVENKTAIQCMKVAYDAGINFFDTGEGYSGGKSEIILGEAIKRYGWKQNDLVISTKLYHGNSNSANPTNPLNNKGLSRKHIIEGMKSSLKRLQLPYVDIVYAHRPDRNTPMEEIVRSFNHLISTEKAFYWGTSEWTASEISDAWSSRFGIDDILSPLAQGTLTGKYNNVEHPPPGSRLAESQSNFIKVFRLTFGNESWKQQLAQVDRLGKIADKLEVTLAQLALAWILKSPNVSSVITGASRPAQILENIRSLEVLDKLTFEIVQEIADAVANKLVAESLRF